MGLRVVTTNPDSIAPNEAIANSGIFGKHSAITSLCFKLNFGFCNRTAKAAQ